MNNFLSFSTFLLLQRPNCALDLLKRRTLFLRLKSDDPSCYLFNLLFRYDTEEDKDMRSSRLIAQGLNVRFLTEREASLLLLEIV